MNRRAFFLGAAMVLFGNLVAVVLRSYAEAAFLATYGAKQLPWNSLVDASGKFLPAEQLRARLERAGAVRGTPVVVYCMVGMRASVAYFVSRYLGHDVRLDDGSIVDWSRRKLPVTRVAQ